MAAEAAVVTTGEHVTTGDYQSSWAEAVAALPACLHDLIEEPCSANRQTANLLQADANKRQSTHALAWLAKHLLQHVCNHIDCNPASAQSTRTTISTRPAILAAPHCQHAVTEHHVCLTTVPD
jgi:hypothetical protein